MANPRKFKRMFAILERLISNLHCAQSMNEYFASENAIEAAKLVMSEAIKKGPDFGNFLRGGSFASCVQVYRNLSSKFDHDAAYFSHLRNNRLEVNQNQVRSPRQHEERRYFPFPIGYCYRFQRNSECRIDNCRFTHACSLCHEKNHGAIHCSKNGPARRAGGFGRRYRSERDNRSERKNAGNTDQKSS